MIPLDYLALRLVRRHLPDRLVRALLARRLFITPGLETTDPEAAVRRFQEALASEGAAVAGQRVLIFGYGGSFAVGRALLRAGARHVVLLDPYAAPEAREPPEALTVVHGPLEAYLESGGPPADLVLSNSVLEHVDDLPRAVPQLARATAPGGRQVHFVDLRDHFFKYPFEMLCHSERIWRGVLNPGSNLNRLRAPDYERIFRASFSRVSVEPIEADLPAFQRARHRIRPEFLTGADGRDAITRILLRAA